MADKPASERTEKPTPERLKKARQEGQVAQSQEVPSALTLGLLLVTLVLTSGWLYGWFCGQMHDGLSFQLTGELDNQMFASVMAMAGTAALTVLAPFMIVMAVGGATGSALLSGLAVSPKAIKFDLSRISPIKGFKNLFSLKAFVKLVISITKLAVLLGVVWQYLSDRLDLVLSLHWAEPAGLLAEIARLICGMGGRVVVAMLVIAGVDMLYQKWNHKRQLMMTRQEVKEERKQYELAPEIKGRMRAMALAMAHKRMLQDVPMADVVVTNPTHYAVALRYTPGEMNAPQMVAKGADFLCEKIKEIAREHNVPIVEKPPLARALYAAGEPGQAIPEVLFVAVAEVLAMIYRLRKKRRLPRGAQLK